ncbi:ParB N-terminal domain-containing protein [Aeoliella sp.]|uniref:ParB N-terminal domain-containing protein n=1 Tax=Aeoliella sp. TaxID=2795800 RepID=UPI003CCC2A7E
MTETPYRTTRKRVASLEPSPENELLYHPVDPDDPEIVELAKSIKREGLHNHLIVTKDNYIVSGHRRYAALVRIGQVMVTCKVMDRRRADMTQDEFVALLRDHNRQRHKSAAEQIRETLVDIDPGEACELLWDRRKLEAEPTDDSLAIAIEGKSKRHCISDQKSDHVKHILKVVNTDRRKYWPLSNRTVHYALLNHEFQRNTKQALAYRNDRQSYAATCDLLVRLRLSGVIPWNAIDDGTRPAKTFNAFHDVRQFIQQELNRLFDGYWRDLLQSQPNYIEVLVEKNTVFSMACEVTREFQIPTSSGRGFNSIDALHDIHRRFLSSGKDRLILVVLSDFDPEGEMIPHSAGRILRDDFGLFGEQLTVIKAGVTREQIERYDLPPQNFAKETSSNHQWFVDRNGGDDTVWELEALEPEDMLSDLRDAIMGVLDIDLFNAEVERENEEAVHLEAARRTAAEALKGMGV